MVLGEELPEVNLYVLLVVAQVVRYLVVREAQVVHCTVGQTVVYSARDR